MTVLSTVRPVSVFTLWSNLTFYTDIRTWHANIEQHASEGVNKILVGNKSDWTDKRAITEEEGRDLAHELGVKFIETSAKINEGVEEAFFTLARCVKSPVFLTTFFLNGALSCLVISRHASLIRRPMLPTHLPPRHRTQSRLTNRVLYKLLAAAHRFSHRKASIRSHSILLFLIYYVPCAVSCQCSCDT
jgi:Ras-related protein Rab-8A